MTSAEINTCEDALRLLAAHLDRELNDHTHAEVQRHLDACRSCYSRAEFERRLKASIAALGHEPVPPELSGRVESLIRQFTVTADE
ncbi:anti-sigma factor family protein [Phytoactinopolyspora mesophila]|uniref:Anti-sigma factor n=1 Tax=Phytoactinopolyspora mesophila TaxID=2650750 RepID=A0A7K3MC88_9ACTN|nr:zf-HC2 domain-containing protein [Phytoactinopolyspora mesophila]NDL60931.1 anti-sigma factor [Phytoactinopolyspora mesophila]